MQWLRARAGERLEVQRLGSSHIVVLHKQEQDGGRTEKVMGIYAGVLVPGNRNADGELARLGRLWGRAPLFFEPDRLPGRASDKPLHPSQAGMPELHVCVRDPSVACALRRFPPLMEPAPKTG